MEIPASCPTGQATIQGIIVDMPAPFAEGHVCTANEAAVLNQTLAENVRNNLASKVSDLTSKAREAAEASGKPYAPPKDEVQGMVAEYLQSYEFGVRRGGGGKMVDPVDAEAWKMAEEMVKAAIRASGATIKSYENKLDALVAKNLEKNPQIRKDAEAVVARRRKSAEAVLDLGALAAE